MADPSYINSNSVDWSKFYSGILPSTPQLGSSPGPTTNQLFSDPSSWTAPTAAGSSSIGSTRTPTQNVSNQPMPTLQPYLGSTNMSAFMGQTGDRLPASHTAASIKAAQNPAVAAATQVAQGGNYAPWGAYSRSLAYNAMNAPQSPMEDALIAQGIIPGQSAASQQGANPGLGGALIGNGIMSPDIAPQGPPPPGIAPTKWAGDNPAAPAAPAVMQPRGPTGQAGGYNYVNGQRTGYAPVNAGGNTYMPNSGAQAYALSNAAGQINALNRQAGAYGNAGGYTYKGGIKTGYAPVQVGGQTINPTNGAQAYSLANAAGQQNAQNKATKAPKTSSSKNNDGSWATGSSSGSPFW